MRYKITKSKNKEHYSIIYDVTIDNKRTTKIYENIGNYEKLKLRSNNQDPIIWLQNYVEEINKKLKEETLPVIFKKNTNKLIEKNKQINFNCGYLFLQKIYYDLKINLICEDINDKYQYKFDLNSILSTLIYSRIIYPSSKLKTFELAKNFIEKPNFDLHQIYRALEIISKESNFIQSELYKNSCQYFKRNKKILYYDCTNFYFEIEQENGIKQYGISKENRPNPIVQMGLFMDEDGIPLAFDITPGNTNEQKTLIPIEEKIIKDFNNSQFVVCTDAGLSSDINRKFNNINGRKFITTQSIKKLKSQIAKWALSNNEWRLAGLPGKIIDISKLEESEELQEKYKDKIFYKERWINENNIEQKIIVTFSLKYKKYQESIREKQIQRAQKLIDSNPKKIGKTHQNDYKRFIDNIKTTKDGEVAIENNYFLDLEKIEGEKKHDGFYAVCTNLEDDPLEIIKVNKNRWEIEESFRIMKSEFKSRPIYLSRDDRIKAHFVTCFISLIIFRYLEKILNNNFTAENIIETLRNMNLKKEYNNYFLPNYERNNITDMLHEKFNFRTDFEIIEEKKIKKFISDTKK